MQSSGLAKKNRGLVHERRAISRSNTTSFGGARGPELFSCLGLFRHPDWRNRGRRAAENFESCAVVLVGKPREIASTCLASYLPLERNFDVS